MVEPEKSRSQIWFAAHPAPVTGLHTSWPAPDAEMQLAGSPVTTLHDPLVHVSPLQHSAPAHDSFASLHAAHAPALQIPEQQSPARLHELPVVVHPLHRPFTHERPV